MITTELILLSLRKAISLGLDLLKEVFGATFFFQGYCFMKEIKKSQPINDVF